jgi:hypothetical protein
LRLPFCFLARFAIWQNWDKPDGNGRRNHVALSIGTALIAHGGQVLYAQRLLGLGVGLLRGCSENLGWFAQSAMLSVSHPFHISLHPSFSILVSLFSPPSRLQLALLFASSHSTFIPIIPFHQYSIHSLLQDDWTIRPPTLGATDLIGGASADCNWPFSCFNANMSHIIGQSTDAIVGGGLFFRSGFDFFRVLKLGFFENWNFLYFCLSAAMDAIVGGGLVFHVRLLLDSDLPSF